MTTMTYNQNLGRKFKIPSLKAAFTKAKSRIKNTVSNAVSNASLFAKSKIPAPALEKGAQISKAIAAKSAQIGNKIDDRTGSDYTRRFGKQLIINAGTTVVAAAAFGAVMSALPAAAVASAGIVGAGLAAHSAVGLVKQIRNFNDEGMTFKQTIAQNPEKVAKLCAKLLTFGFGSAAGLMSGLDFIPDAAAADVVIPTVESIDALGASALDIIDSDSIVSPVEAELNSAANNLASATPDAIADMKAAGLDNLASDALLTYDALDDGVLRGTSVGAELIQETEISTSTAVAEPNPELAKDIIESTAQIIMDHPNADLSLSATSEVVVQSADTLAHDGQFNNDAIAVERLEAVVDAGGVHAEIAQQSLEDLLANQELGVTSYTIQSGDNLTKIVESNDVYSKILDSVAPEDRAETLQALITHIADTNGIENINSIYAIGQEIQMVNLSGVDPSTLEITRDIAAENIKAGLSHYNKPSL